MLSETPRSFSHSPAAQLQAAPAEELGPRLTGVASAADLAAVAVRASLDRLAANLARSAAAFVAVRAWRTFGYARIEDHARERFGRSGRWLRDLATLGAAVAAEPRLAAALTGADGARPVGRVAAILVARALGLGPIDAWIALARHVSVRDLREAIRQARSIDAGAGVDTEAGAGTGADSDPDERILVRLPVPLPILAAFDETRDLHRAVEGREASVMSFVEALIGEAQSARPEAAPPFVSPLVHGAADAVVEAALRRSTSAWEALPDPPGTPDSATAPSGASDELAAVVTSLQQFHLLQSGAGLGDAAELDRQLRTLVRLEDELEARLGEILAGMGERQEWSRLRFASVGHYAEERLGMSRSRAGERARLARVLRGLPRLGAACASGRISMEAAALVHRLIGDAPVPADLEQAWIDRATGATIKRMRDEARAIGRYRARSGPAGVASPMGAPAPVGPPMPLDDRQWHASLRREPGTARRRVLEFGLRVAGLKAAAESAALNAAPRFGAGQNTPDPAAPESDAFHAPPTEPDVFQALPHEPDVFLRLRLPADVAIEFIAAIEAARHAAEQKAASVPWDAPWPPGDAGAPPGAAPSDWAARIAFIRGRQVPLWVGLLALLEEFVATWDHDLAVPERRDDRVFIREGWSCAAPGCTSRRHLEDHHVVYRSRGGSDLPANRVTLCRFHHQRGEHGNLMSVRGEAPLGLSWRLGRPDVAVCYRNERTVARQPGAAGPAALSCPASSTRTIGR